MKPRTKHVLRAVPAATVQLTLPAQGVLKDVHSAFYGLCIQAGKEVLTAMMEADRLALCGPKGVPNADRRAVRGGSTRSAVVLGGQRIAVQRPRGAVVRGHGRRHSLPRRVILVALGIEAQGTKHILGLREVSTESTRVVRSLLSDLVDRASMPTALDCR